MEVYVKRLTLIVVLFVLASVMAAAAFAAVRQITSQAQNGKGGASMLPLPLIEEGDAGGGVAEARLKVSFDMAPELPSRPPDVIGGFLRQEDNRFFVGSGFVDIRGDGNGGYTTDHDGPVVEVLVGRDTLFYSDVTNTQADGQAGAVELYLQQEVQRVDRLEQMPYPAFVSVWGERRGDRVTADVILYRDRP
jgi:hypothetical protein